MVDDQPVLRVAPYFGEEDREGVELEIFDVAPNEIEASITETAAVETVRFMINKYTSNLSKENVDGILSAGFTSQLRAHPVDAFDGKLELATQFLSEYLLRALCDTLSASSSQIHKLTARITVPPVVTPTLSRKPLYYVPKEDDYKALESFRKSIASRPEYSAINDSDIFDLPPYFMELIDPTLYASLRTFNYLHRIRCDNEDQVSLPGLAPLFIKADRTAAGHRLINDAQNVTKSGEISIEKDHLTSYKNYFNQSDKNLASSGIGKLNFKGGYSKLVESYQLLYCRRYVSTVLSIHHITRMFRCFIFDCPLHKTELPAPKERNDPPPLPVSHINGVSLSYEKNGQCKAGVETRHQRFSNNMSSTENNSSYDSKGYFMNQKYCLYCGIPAEALSKPSADILKIDDDFSATEMLITVKLKEVFGGGDIDRIALCLGTKQPFDISRFLETVETEISCESNESAMDADDTVTDTSINGDDASSKKRISKNFLSKKGKKPKTGAPALRPSKNGFEPCDHDGPCTQKNNCSCKNNSVNCERFCGCRLSCCNLRYEGCNCKAVGASCMTNACPCFASGRECDPSNCGTCGAAIHPFFLDELKKSCSETKTDYRMCGNVGLRRGERKRLALGKSHIQGWGLFTMEPAEKNELIVEYKGEVISNNEAERRGVVYDKIGCSYLFNLHSDLVVDSTRLGNTVRFVNHCDEKYSNCYPVIKSVDGDCRIGLYAKRTIIAGEELTFDYKYTEEAAPDWVKAGAQVVLKRKRSKKQSTTQKKCQK
jgi:hypothetical protein